jgi:hypothetical protein
MPFGPSELRILAVTLSRTMLSGAELASLMETRDWKALSESLGKLQSEKLLKVSGDLWNVKDLPYATIGVPPSSKEAAYQTLRAAGVSVSPPFA